MKVINSTELMYGAFQACRCGNPGAIHYLRSLASVLCFVRETCVLDVPIDEAIIERLFPERPYPPGIFAGDSWTGLMKLEVPNRRFFDLAEISVQNLSRLLAAGSMRTVRRLGYAMHNVPQMIRIPDSYGHCVFGLRVMQQEDLPLLSQELLEAFKYIRETGRREMLELARARAQITFP